MLVICSSWSLMTCLLTMITIILTLWYLIRELIVWSVNKNYKWMAQINSIRITLQTHSYDLLLYKAILKHFLLCFYNLNACLKDSRKYRFEYIYNNFFITLFLFNITSFVNYFIEYLESSRSQNRVIICKLRKKISKIILWVTNKISTKSIIQIKTIENSFVKRNVVLRSRWNCCPHLMRLGNSYKYCKNFNFLWVCTCLVSLVKSKQDNSLINKTI